MSLKAGLKRREIPQLKKMLDSGATVESCYKSFKVEPEVVFQFAKDWGIQLKETPESLKLVKHEAMIEAEVQRRLEAAKESAKKEPPASKSSFEK